MSTHIETDRLVRTFIRIRDERSALAAAYNEKDEALKANLRTIENELLARAQADGVKGFKTAEGTTYIAEDVHSSIAVPDDFREFVLSTGDLDFYEQRPSLKHIKEYQERHDGAVPPGIKLFRENRMRVRGAKKATNKGEADES